MPSYDLGYDVARSMRVMNGTTTLLKKGETVVWDATTPVITDKARRVKRQVTADVALGVAGVCMNDIPVSGGYGTIAVEGTVRARVNSAVTAGSGLVADFVSGSPGVLRLRALGEYGLAAVAQDTAVAEGGDYWADVLLLGPNEAAMQETLRGGAFNTNSMLTTMVGVATGSLPVRFPVMRVPVAGAITGFWVYIGDTTIAASDSNVWLFTLSTYAGTGIATVTNSAALGGGALTLNTWRSYDTVVGLVNTVVTADTVLKVVASVGAGTPVDGQAGDAWMARVQMDTGLNLFAAFGI